MTRVAYVCADSGVPIFGRKGCSVHVQEMIRALKANGASVQVFSNSVEGDRPADLKELSLHRLPRPVGETAEREKIALMNNDSLKVALRQHGPFELIYERYSLWSFGAMEYAAGSGIPSILEVNAPLIEEQQTYRHLSDRETAESVAKRVFRAAGHVVTVSAELAAYVKSVVPERDNIFVVSNGISASRFPPHSPQLFPSKPGTFTVGFLGSLKAWHGVSVLVDAFDRLHAEDPSDLRLLIVGDGPERKNILQQIANRNLENCVQLTGSVAPEQVAATLASMDVAVAPYPQRISFYFSPLKIFEYMAAALPIVASDLGQISEIIQHEVNGILCSPGDPEAFATALRKLRRSAELRQRLSTNARAEVLANHDWKQIARRILQLVNQVEVF